MEKTKFGIPAALLSVILCLLGYYGGYVIAVIAIGAVLLLEEKESLRKLAVKVLALMLCFSLANTVIYLIPTVMNLISSLLEIFHVYFHLNFIDRICNFLSNALSAAKMVVFALLTFNAWKGKEFKVPLLDQFLEKFI